MTKSTTIDLQDRIDEIRDEKIPSIEESKRDLAREAKEEYETADDAPAKYHQAHREFEEDIAELEEEASAHEDFIERHGTGEFTIRKLDGSQLLRLEDEVNDASFEVDPEREEIEGVPKNGFRKAMFTRLALVDYPDSCPETDRGYCDVGAFDGDVYSFLFEKVKLFNNTGQTDLGNSSLADTMQDV
ncbi:hypothetical protein [Natrinema thermotolerans]|uniref:hypothetical protein n=1 Tax=Natrinema thermotolerans TaxID=121872 RepID=UPI000679503F|nr:hypothetical protein [Natrinema thermotolerans]QCC57366.1 hypothetical protein DVR14_01405 [Natrinema thermotolerans]